MAGGKIARYAQAFPDRLKLSRFVNRDGKPSVLKMSYPTRAAPAIWIFMYKYGGSLG